MDLSPIIKDLFKNIIPRILDYGIMGVISFIAILFVIKKLIFDKNEKTITKDKEDELNKKIKKLENDINILKIKIDKTNDINNKRFRILYELHFEGKDVSKEFFSEREEIKNE